MTPKRESVCRICGTRLSFMGIDRQVHWEHGGADDKGLVCEGCIPMAKLEQLRKEIKDKKDEEGS